MSQVDITYNRLLDNIEKSGYKYETANRPGIECTQISSVSMEISLERFPLISTKDMYFKGIVAELIWFLRGDTNIKYLVDNDVNIWNKDAYNWYLKTQTKDTEDPMSFEDFITEIKEQNHYDYGDVGRNYSAQWKDWTEPVGFEAEPREYYILKGFDQLQNLITNLSAFNPINRRHIVTAWNPAEVGATALPPCHWSWEVIPRPLSLTDRIGLTSAEDQEHLIALWDEMAKGNEEAKDKLQKSLVDIPKYAFTLKWNQRSVDTFLGLPFNIASYALLSHIIGHLTDMVPITIIGNLSNVHIYGPHMEQVKEQLGRDPLKYAGCHLKVSDSFLSNVKNFKKGKLTLAQFFDSLQITDFTLEGYESFGKLKAEMFEPTA